ncbi:hypothetical protein R3P38DRAFT_3305817 [Favolaschia claudopus]|uniref:Uncharacterized protein n=1 Tax=Favolaschia claudopus TaxID=2862362 RepID=A0AAW0DIL4_9AGAR
MVLVSFPPLLGHEILTVLQCGVTTLAGEIACFFAFKYACTFRGKTFETNLNIEYGALAHVVRQGGLLIVLVMRYSVSPRTVLSTAMFSTVGVSPHIFLAAAFLSVPKSFVPVLYWIYRKMEQAKEAYIYSRRNATQAKAAKECIE